MAASLGELIYSRIGELARISDDPDRLTRLYLSPAHKRAADLVGAVDARGRHERPHRCDGQRRSAAGRARHQTHPLC